MSLIECSMSEIDDSAEQVQAYCYLKCH